MYTKPFITAMKTAAYLTITDPGFVPCIMSHIMSTRRLRNIIKLLDTILWLKCL